MNTNIIDQYLDSMPLRGIPSCELIVTEAGKTVYRHTVGMDDANRNIYFVCSVSKITTCVAAMKLLEEGKIELDAPVSKYLPAFKHMMVKQADGTIKPAQNELLIRHLFTMTGGLNYNLRTAPILRATANSDAGTLAIVNSFAESPLEFEPGSKFLYSLCHDVLAAVVEAVSGLHFSEYVKQHILDPLEMKTTGYHLPEDLKHRVLRQYRYIHGISECTEVEPFNPYIFTPNYDSGGAGLYTTAEDQAKLLTALACDGKSVNGYQLLKPETIEMMEIGQLSDEVRRGFMGNRLYGYSWGLCGRVHVNPIVSDSKSSIGEFGWDGATGPYALVDRRRRLAMYFGVHVYGCEYLYNHVHPALRNMVYEMLYESR